MKQECLVVAAKKRRKYGSYLGEIRPVPDNLINRDFQAAAPNEKWLTDITEFHIPAGKVYLSPMIDCLGQKIDGRNNRRDASTHGRGVLSEEHVSCRIVNHWRVVDLGGQRVGTVGRRPRGHPF